MRKVTRTLIRIHVVAGVVDAETLEFQHYEMSFPTMSEEKLIRKCKQKCEENGLIFLKVVSKESVTVRYSMPEEQFIALAEAEVQ